MNEVGKGVVRILFGLLVLTSGATLLEAYLAQSDVAERVRGATDGDLAFDTQQSTTPPRDGITVVTTSERVSDDDSRENVIVAFGPDGQVIYQNDSRRVYNDVDPVPGTRATVLYVAADRLPRSECGGTTDCWHNVVEVVNLTTGEVRQPYAHVTAMARGQWHDVDRINDTHLIVADIALDRVFVVNTSSGIVDWEWHAQSAFPLDGGGLFPGDWTHLNDVELLDDGTIMASLRNQDQVVFIDPRKGIQANRTLGDEDDGDILYEQHNPDYIPGDRGGPAIVLADSENNRVVEYQRTAGSGGGDGDRNGDGDGEWERTWVWRDLHLQWPRDADRLPNGHTLITDSNGRRVVEVDREGEIVWQVSINGAYDAERLGTGDESAGGESATELGLASRGSDLDTNPREFDGPGLRERLALSFKDALPGLVVNAALFVLPAWVGFVELLALAILLVAVACWAIAELWWSPWTIRVSLERSS